MINFVYQFLLGWFIVYRIFQATYLGNFLGISVSMWGKIITYSTPFFLLAVFIFSGVYRRMTKKKLYFSVLILVLLIIESAYVKDTTLIITFLFIIAYPEKLDPKKFAIRMGWTIMIAILYIFILCNLGFIVNNTGYRNGNFRQSGGFVGANALGNNVVVGCIIYFYGKIDKWKARNTIFFLLLCLAVHFYTYSRMATIFILVLAIIGHFYKYIIKWKISKIFYWMTSFLFPILFGFILTVVLYFHQHTGSELYTAINNLFSTRLYWCIYYLENYGISLFGNNIETYSAYNVKTYGGSWMGLDNSYMMIAVKFGIVFVVIFILGYYFLGRRFKKNNDLAGAIMAVIFLLMGITENYLYSVGYNFTMMIFAYEFYLRKTDSVNVNSLSYNSEKSRAENDDVKEKVVSLTKKSEC